MLKNPILLGLIFFCSFLNQTWSFPLANIVSLEGDVSFSKDGKSWIPLKEGDELEDFAALKVRDKSYLKVILKDHSLIQVDADSLISLSSKKDFIKVAVGRGRMRILSYKDEKVIQTPQRQFSIFKGEYLVDVYKEKSLLKTSLTAYSGHVFYKGEPVIPESYEPRPVGNFPPKREMVSYDIAIVPPAPDEKQAGRAIASVPETSVFEIEGAPEEFNEEFDDNDYQIPKEKGEIWVHDIVYDEAVRVIEKFVARKVEEMVPTAVKEASQNLVWDVANKSIKRWGVYYAKKGIETEVPLAVNSAYQNEVTKKNDGDFSRQNVATYENSTGKVAEIRTYRVAKNLVETKGYERGWQETRDYIERLLPEVVTPIIVKEIYEKVLPHARESVQKVIEKSELVSTPEVEKLIRHISLLTSQSLTKLAVRKYGKIYATQEAKKVVRDISHGISHDIATYMASKAKSKATNLITTLFARQRARGIASGVAKESNEEAYQEMQKRQREHLFRAHR